MGTFILLVILIFYGILMFCPGHCYRGGGGYPTLKQRRNRTMNGNEYQNLAMRTCSILMRRRMTVCFMQYLA